MLLVSLLVQPAEGKDMFGSISVLRLVLLLGLNLKKKKKKSNLICTKEPKDVK